MSNLKQVGTGYFMYANQYSGKYYPRRTGSSADWNDGRKAFICERGDRHHSLVFCSASALSDACAFNRSNRVIERNSLLPSPSDCEVPRRRPESILSDLGIVAAEVMVGGTQRTEPCHVIGMDKDGQ